MWFVFAWFNLEITGLFSPEYIDADWGPGKVWNMLPPWTATASMGRLTEHLNAHPDTELPS